MRTAEETVALVRRLAEHYPDAVIAGSLNRQGRRTAKGHRFEGNRVCNLRRHWNIPCFEPKLTSDDGELLTIKKAAAALGVSRQTLLQRVKRGELEAVHVTRGRQKGLRIKVLARQAGLFQEAS